MNKHTETDSYTQRTNWWLPDRKGVGGAGKKGEGIKKWNEKKWHVKKTSENFSANHKNL